MKMTALEGGIEMAKFRSGERALKLYSTEYTLSALARISGEYSIHKKRNRTFSQVAKLAKARE